MTTEPRATADGGGTTVAVVLTGAIARGAFQAGALAELVPALEGQGLAPTIWLGTSAGAINAVLWGSAAHRGAVAAAESVVDVWRGMDAGDVYASLPFSVARAGWQFTAGAMFGLGPGTTSLLDTRPLRRTATRVLDVAQLAANVADGVLSAVGVVATRVPADTDSGVPGAASGRSVLFLDERVPGGHAGDPGRALDVMPGSVVVDHVLASSAFPVVFPPTRITDPEGAEGWYVDGGVRLNAPLNPAIDLGATKVVVISATATTYSQPPPPDLSARTPDIADAAAQVAHAVLADRMIEDLASVRRTNQLIAQATAADRPDLLRDSGGRAYRPIDVMAISPPPGQMAAIARKIFERRTSGLGRITELDNWLIGQLIRGAGDGIGHSELLSYFFFDEEYFAESIQLGGAVARAALARGWNADRP